MFLQKFVGKKNNIKLNQLKTYTNSLTTLQLRLQWTLNYLYFCSFYPAAATNKYHYQGQCHSLIKVIPKVLCSSPPKQTWNMESKKAKDKPSCHSAILP